MRRPATTGRERRRAPAGLVAGFGALVVVTGAVWIFRAPVAEWAVAAVAAANGLGPAEITVEEIGLTRLRARHIRLRDGAVRLDRLVAEYSLVGVARGRLDRIVLGGLRIAGRLDAGGVVVIGADPPLVMPSASRGPPSLPDPPADSIVIEDAVVTLETANGKLSLGLEGTVERGGDGAITFGLEADLSHGGARARASLSGSARRDEPGSVTLRLVSRHRGELGGMTGEGAAVIDIAVAEHTLRVAWELTETAVRRAGIAASGILGRGSLEVRDGAVGAFDGTLAIARLRAGGLDAAVPVLALSYDGKRVSARGRLRGALGEIAFRAASGVGDPARPVSFALEGFVNAAAIAALLPWPARAKGRLVVDLGGELRRPAAAIAAVPPRWRRLAGLLTLTGTAGFDFADVEIEDRVSLAAATASANFAVADGAIRIETVAGLTASGVWLGPAWSGGLPGVVRARLARRPVSIAIGGGGEGGGGERGSPLALEARALADGWEVRVITGARVRSGRARITAEIDTRLELDRAGAVRQARLAYLSLALKGLRHGGIAADVEVLLSEAAGSATEASGRLAVTASASGSPPGTTARFAAALDLDGTVALAGGRVTLRPEAGAKIVVSRLDVPRRLRLAAPLTIGFGGKRDRLWLDLGDGGVGYRLRLSPIETVLDLVGHGRVLIRLPLARVAGNAGATRLVFADGEVTAAFAPIAVAGISGRLGWGPSRKAEARLTLKRIRHTGQRALIAPLALDIEASLDGDLVKFAIRSPADAPGPSVAITGRHDVSRATGAADLRLGPVRFEAGGPRPGDLSPRLAGLIEDAEGALGVAGRITWDADGLEPRLVVTLDRLGFATAIGRISEIDGRIHLDGVAPLRTPPGQRVSARAVVGKLAPIPITARFQMRDDGKLVIESGSLDFAGGTLSTENLVADPAKRDVAATVTVSDLSVERLLALVGIPELSGTGRLAGRIEVRVAGGRLAAVTGSLATTGKGVLRLSDPAVLRTLARREDTVGLAMKALADFRYDSLRVEIDVADGASGTVLVRLKGANPEVLDGYPFAFNINLETDFARLARLLMGGARAAEAFVGTTLGGAAR